MADDKKKKDEIEENMDQDNGGDIHEADDTFGLPDIDFDPVTPDEPEEAPASEDSPSESTPEETPEKEEAEVDQPYMYASRAEEEKDSSDQPEEEQEPAQEPEAETAEEESGTDGYYHSSETEEGTETDYSASMEEPEEEKSAYVPGSYAARQESSNKTGIIIGILLALIIIIIGAWYFVWERPAQQVEAERIRQEQLAQQQADEEAERQRAAEAERKRAEEEAARRAAEEEEAAAAEPETGTIETISARTGRYYVVVASAIDGDLAMDYAQKLADSGKNVKIIAPYGNVLYHRVTIQDLDSWAEASNVADELKAEYGDGVWVKKY